MRYLNYRGVVGLYLWESLLVNMIHHDNLVIK